MINITEGIDKVLKDIKVDWEKNNKWIVFPNQYKFDQLFEFDQNDLCLHNQCSECHGTGIKSDGGCCFHNLSCSCKRCSPR